MKSPCMASELLLPFRASPPLDAALTSPLFATTALLKLVHLISELVPLVFQLVAEHVMTRCLLLQGPDTLVQVLDPLLALPVSAFFRIHLHAEISLPIFTFLQRLLKIVLISLQLLLPGFEPVSLSLQRLVLPAQLRYLDSECLQ